MNPENKNLNPENYFIPFKTKIKKKRKQCHIQKVLEIKKKRKQQHIQKPLENKKLYRKKMNINYCNNTDNKQNNKTIQCQPYPKNNKKYVNSDDWMFDLDYGFGLED